MDFNHNFGYFSYSSQLLFFSYHSATRRDNYKPVSSYYDTKYLNRPGAFNKNVVQIWDFEEETLPNIQDAESNVITKSAIMVRLIR